MTYDRTVADRNEAILYFSCPERREWADDKNRALYIENKIKTIITNSGNRDLTVLQVIMRVDPYVSDLQNVHGKCGNFSSNIVKPGTSEKIEIKFDTLKIDYHELGKKRFSLAYHIVFITGDGNIRSTYIVDDEKLNIILSDSGQFKEIRKEGLLSFGTHIDLIENSTVLAGIRFAC